MKKRRLLVTGGAGFIGANFVHYWAAAHPADRIVVLDALTYAGNIHSLDSVLGHDAFRFVKGDIGDTDAVIALLHSEEIDTIVHFAAESHVDRSILGPEAFVQTNVVGTTRLLNAARAAWQGDGGFDGRRFHHVSTDEVYGSLGRTDPAFVETTPYDPSSPYAASKAASDHFVRAYRRTYGLPVTISNCSNNYGPYQFPEKLIPLMIINALCGQALPVYGDGSNVRDWLFVTDHCVALEQILGLNGNGETFNVGGGAECSNIDIVRMLCRLVDDAFKMDGGLRERFPRCPAAEGRSSSELVTFVQDRPGHDWRYAINAGKLAQATGYFPLNSLESGLKRTLHWYLAHETWWQPLLDERYLAWLQQNYVKTGRG